MLTRRLFSLLSRTKPITSTVTHKATASTLNTTEIAQAIDLLTSKTKLPREISPKERQRYIAHFTAALNHDLDKHNNNPITSHFEHSLQGLLNLTTSNGDVNALDAVSLRQRIQSCANEIELLNVFDSLVHAGNLSLANFKLILMNKHCFDLQHILNKFEFLDPTGKEFVDFKVLVVIKATVLGDQKLASEMYKANIEAWVKDFNEGQMAGSVVLRKSLFQVIYKLDRDLKLIQSMKYDQGSLVLLVEALPRQMNFYINEIMTQNKIELSQNQTTFIDFMRFLASHSKNKETPLLTKRLIKSSRDNQLFKETSDRDSEVTIHKHRFRNEMIQFAEEICNAFKNNTELMRMIDELNETDEVWTDGALLKFI